LGSFPEPELLFVFGGFVNPFSGCFPYDGEINEWKNDRLFGLTGA
jgi:hypothetical protein